jgi:CheY-like chemotaxis protein/HPt (histidine-containing phosphotransfer) domain-containing protein
MVATQAELKGLTIGAIVDPAVPTMLVGDAKRLQQVLVNLIGNGVKFTEHGSVVAEASLQRMEGDAAIVRFAVTDTGVGIAAADQDRLFEDFSQVDTSITRRHSGTGLGLSISRKLVEDMGGDIAVSSAVGEGSTFAFTVRLPVAADVSTEDVDALARLNVLVVDDNEVNRRVFEGYLSALGAACAMTDSAAAAWEALEHASAAGRLFDVVLLDHSMPDRDGLGFAADVRADPRFAGLKLVLVSSISQHVGHETESEAVIDARLTKPLRRARLVRALRDVTAQGAPEDQTTATPVPVPAPAPAPAPAPDSADEAAALRILVAEDNDVNQDIAQRMLTSWGHTVDLAADGLEAVEAAKLVRYDVILMDVHMPELDGMEAAKRIRSRANPCRDSVIVALSADVMVRDSPTLKAAGFDDYLAKPFASADLKAMVRRWSAGRGTGVGAADTAPPPDATGPGSAPPVLDDAVLRDLHTQLGSETAAAIVTKVLDALPGIVEQVQAARPDLPRLADLAHAAAGSTASAGFRKFAGVMRSLEKNARAGDAAGVDADCAVLDAAAEQTRAALRGTDFVTG